MLLVIGFSKSKGYSLEYNILFYSGKLSVCNFFCPIKQTNSNIAHLLLFFPRLCFELLLGQTERTWYYSLTSEENVQFLPNSLLLSEKDGHFIYTIKAPTAILNKH